MNELAPLAVGVPEMVPVDVPSDNPAGNAPDVTAHVYEPDPPVADNVCEYATPSDPGSNEVGAISSATALIEIDSSFDTEFDAASTTLTVNVAFPLDVGVPAMTPLGASSTPAGNEPDSTDQV